MTTAQKPRNGRAASNAPILDRQPPFDREAEQAVLGSILLVPEVADEVAMHLQPEDFHDPAHQTLYRAMLEIHNGGKRLDVMLLVDALKKAGDFERIGGAAYIGQVANVVPNAANAVHYAGIVAEKSALRLLIQSASEILQDAHGSSDDWAAQADRAEQRIFAIRERRTGTETTSISDSLSDALDRLENRQNTGSGMATGYAGLDDLTGGLQAGELIILAARPSMGKSALALNIAENVARGEPDGSVLFVSLEMSAIELADRLLVSRARVSSYRTRSGTINSDERRRIVEAASDLALLPLMIDDSPYRSVGEIAALARRQKRKGGLNLVVVDYLQLITTETASSKENREQQVAQISRRLKGLARELEVPVLCLAQLNRQADAGDGRPKLSHLRESGAIEQDADVVLFVHRDNYQATGDDANSNEAAVIVAKQRNGRTGDAKLLWFGEFIRFDEPAMEDRHDEFDEWNNRTDAF